MSAEPTAVSTASQRNRIVSRWLAIVMLAVAAILVGLACFNFVRFWGNERLAGRIVEAGSGYVVVRDQADTATRVVFSDTTELRLGRSIVGPASLQAGEFVMVFGARRNGEITAVRIVIFEDRPHIPTGAETLFR